jgi:hypothetical protein
MANPIVPRTINGFNGWITGTAARLIATNTVTTNPYWQDYGLDTGINTEWQSRKTAWLPMFSRHSGRHDSIDNKDIQDFIKSMSTFAEKPLLTIEGSAITGNEDAFIFNFHLGHGTPTTTAEKIMAQVSSELIMGGRGIVNITVRRATDETRPSKPEHSDSVQYAYLILDKPDDIDPSKTLITPDTAGMVKDLSTHAHFHLDLGVENMSKWIAIYFRWYNTKHPELAGPWSVVQFFVIS